MVAGTQLVFVLRRLHCEIFCTLCSSVICLWGFFCLALRPFISINLPILVFSGSDCIAFSWWIDLIQKIPWITRNFNHSIQHGYMYFPWCKNISDQKHTIAWTLFIFWFIQQTQYKCNTNMFAIRKVYTEQFYFSRKRTFGT